MEWSENICFYSSLLFIVNAGIMMFFGHYIYASLFILLSFSSTIVHLYNTYNYDSFAYTLDKILVSTIVLYGAFIFFTKCIHLSSTMEFIIALIIVTTFLVSVFLYEYGYYTNQYCFCKSNWQIYHFILHLTGGIGHLLIAIL